jgi:hypothetical protein
MSDLAPYNETYSFAQDLGEQEQYLHDVRQQFASFSERVLYGYSPHSDGRSTKSQFRELTQLMGYGDIPAPDRAVFFHGGHSTNKQYNPGTNHEPSRMHVRGLTATILQAPAKELSTEVRTALIAGVADRASDIFSLHGRPIGGTSALSTRQARTAAMAEIRGLQTLVGFSDNPTEWNQLDEIREGLLDSWHPVLNKARQVVVIGGLLLGSFLMDVEEEPLTVTGSHS